ncbi:MAG: DegV family protein, partial [Clostridia bacterium]|nr:DegV family protein [Clostridia bacterium]
NFILSCCSTVDLPYDYLQQREIPVLFYTYFVDGNEYEDDMGRDPEALPRFYGFLAAEKFATTSQVNVSTYYNFFQEQLEHGDLLHLAFTSGQSGSVHNAFSAADLLREKYPERKITIVDTLCSSSGYGMLVDHIADMRDQGCSMEEAEQWALENRNKVHHQFFCTDLQHFRRSGRISGAAATIAAVLDICPIMRLNDEGRIIAYDKVRGKKRALRTTVNNMAEHAQNGLEYAGKCFICHSDCPDMALRLKEAILERFHHINGDIRICDIGTIIASHCGPGTVAVFFFGDERPHME